jgi:hypothetical protein
MAQAAYEKQQTIQLVKRAIAHGTRAPLCREIKAAWWNTNEPGPDSWIARQQDSQGAGRLRRVTAGWDSDSLRRCN